MALTSMMQQYLELKRQHEDCLLLFRLGDFYEMFFRDAVIVSRELGLTLTGRDCGLKKRAPMCGVPYHALDGYLVKLVANGHRVAICEQLEDPALTKTLVKRGITRIITPGTITEDSMLDEGEYSYITSIAFMGKNAGIAYSDLSTGAFYALELKKDDLKTELERIRPKEIIYGAIYREEVEKAVSEAGITASLHAYPDWSFEPEFAKSALIEHFKVATLDGFGLTERGVATCAAGALMSYFRETQMNGLEHITAIRRVERGAFMYIDPFTKRNMELTETLRERTKKGSLLWLLDHTKTPMGARMLRTIIEQPLNTKEQIDERLDAVSELFENADLRTEVRRKLADICDIERIITGISYCSIDARRCLALKKALLALPELKEALAEASAEELKRCEASIDTLSGLCELLEDAIAEEPPVGITDGGIIKSGYNFDVDKLRDARDNGVEWLKKLEARERESTGIKNLKIGYNRVFGYYIEISRANAAQAPYYYIRRQTLTGAERFVTKELKEMEDSILGSKEKCEKLEYAIFVNVRERLKDYISALQQIAASVAKIDCYQSLAQAAFDNDYVRPTITEDGVINIKNGRHPVVERSLDGQFVANDAYLDRDDDSILMITGPNMAGKSTFMRQTGLIVLMAHMGSFVPASRASVCVTDRVFTRVGASDDLASGQSTFMVEMNELASILNSATDKSLLILDEIGRGTGTLDGLSIARACVDYISEKIGAKTLFATHYHELTELEGVIHGVKNYSVAIKEHGDEIVFLHSIRPGGADKSFGIEVARLAGLPRPLLLKASSILNTLRKNPEAGMSGAITAEPVIELRDDIAGVRKRLADIDANALTPLEALNIIFELKDRLDGEKAGDTL